MENRKSKIESERQNTFQSAINLQALNSYQQFMLTTFGEMFMVVDEGKADIVKMM